MIPVPFQGALFSVPTSPAPKVRSIEEQTGWHRPGAMAICQDIKTLEAVTEFDYDLSDRDFVRYYESRTGVQISLCDHERFCELDHAGSWKDMANGPLNWRVPLSELPRPRYLSNNEEVSDKEFQSWMGVWRIQRGKLQDCWELYKTQNQRRPE